MLKRLFAILLVVSFLFPSIVRADITDDAKPEALLGMMDAAYETLKKESIIWGDNQSAINPSGAIEYIRAWQRLVTSFYLLSLTTANDQLAGDHFKKATEYWIKSAIQMNRIEQTAFEAQTYPGSIASLREVFRVETEFADIVNDPNNIDSTDTIVSTEADAKITSWTADPESMRKMLKTRVTNLSNMYSLLLKNISEGIYGTGTGAGQIAAGSLSSTAEPTVGVLLIVKAELDDLDGFDVKWDADPNKILSSVEGDWKIGRIGASAISGYENLFGAADNVANSQVDQVFSQTATTVSQWDYTHEFVAFTKRVSDEVLLEALGEDTDLTALTGYDLWDTIDGNEAVSAVGRAEYEQGPALRSAYLAMVASSAVYTPLLSKVGDSDYMEALESLINPDQLKEVRDVFTTLTQYRKPLYILTDSISRHKATSLGYSWIELTGASQRLTLGQLMDATNREAKMVGVVMRGKMIKTDNTYVYQSNELINVGDDTLKTREVYAEDGHTMADKGDTYSRAVFELDYSYEDPTPGTVTALLVKNMFEDEYLKNLWQQRSSDIIYLDAFGNLILSDGTVIIPAAANPTYFAVPFHTTTINDGESWWYNPYTVAWWNNYPTLYGKTDTPSVQMKKDVKKYFATFEDSDQISEFISLSGTLGSSTLNQVRNPIDLVNLQNFTNDTTASGRNALEQFSFAVAPVSKGSWNKWFEQFRSTGYYYPFFTYTDASGGGTSQTVSMVEVMSGSINIGSTEEAYKTGINAYPLRMIPLMPEGQSYTIFPYISPAREQATAMLGEVPPPLDYTAAKVIAQNFYAYLTKSVQSADVLGETAIGNGMIREAYMYYNVVCNVLDGMVTPIAYEKSLAYETLIFTDSSSVFERIFVGMARHLANFASGVTGLLGAMSPDSSSLLTKLYYFLMTYKFVILFFSIVILLFVYLRSRSFSKTLISFLILFIGVYGFLFMAPRAMPFAVGTITNVLSQKTGSRILLHRGEQYQQVLTAETDSDFLLGTVKLYDLKLQDAYNLRLQKNLDPNVFMSDVVPLEDVSGVWLVGTEIRLDLEAYFKLNQYHVEYDTALSAWQMVKKQGLFAPELIEYYTPLFKMEEGFVSTLNKFSQFYSLPRSVTGYPNGFYKDASLVPSYIHSYPFLQVIPVVTERMREKNLLEIELAAQHFPAGDILNLNSWLVETEFNDLPYELQHTVWVQTMWRNGYYHSEFGRERRELLARNVNAEAQAFLIESITDAGLVSDENLVRLTALYATMAFNDQISRFDDIVYPRYVAMNEFSVTDIITATVLSNSVRYMFYDVDLVSNVYVEKGLGGLFACCVALVAGMILAFMHTLLFQIVYVGGVFLVVVFAFIGKSVASALGFVSKVLAVLLASNLLLIGMLNLYEALPYKFNIYLLAMFMVALLAAVYMLVKLIAKTTKWGANPRNLGLTSKLSAYKRNMGYRDNSGHSYSNSGHDPYMDDYGNRHSAEDVSAESEVESENARERYRSI